MGSILCCFMGEQAVGKRLSFDPSCLQRNGGLYGSVWRMRIERGLGHGVLIGGKERRGLRVSGKDGAFEVEENGEGDEEDVADEALRATIRQSKKVLAKQKDLLQKIVASRKLVSSVESSFLNTQLEADSNDEGP